MKGLILFVVGFSVFHYRSNSTTMWSLSSTTLKRCCFTHLPYQHHIRDLQEVFGKIRLLYLKPPKDSKDTNQKARWVTEYATRDVVKINQKYRNYPVCKDHHACNQGGRTGIVGQTSALREIWHRWQHGRRGKLECHCRQHEGYHVDHFVCDVVVRNHLRMGSATHFHSTGQSGTWQFILLSKWAVQCISIRFSEWTV